jgi:hypothetical protein
MDLRLGGAQAEKGCIAAAGNIDQDWFFGAFDRIEGGDALAQLGGIDTHYIVDAGVVILMAAKDVYANLMFGDQDVIALERPLPYIKQKLAQPGGSPQLVAGADPFQQIETLRGVERLRFVLSHSRH